MWHTFFFSFPGCVILQSVTDRSQQQQPHWKSNSNKNRKPKHTCLASQLEKDPLKPGAATSSSFLQMFPIPTRKNTFFIDAVKLLFLSWDTEEDVTPSRNAEVVFGQRGDRRKDLDTAKKPPSRQWVVLRFWLRVLVQRWHKCLSQTSLSNIILVQKALWQMI